MTVARASKLPRFLSLLFFVASQFTGREGKYVPIAETIRGFKEIIEGKHDALPEQAFYMVGTIDEVVETAKKMATAKVLQRARRTVLEPWRLRVWSDITNGRHSGTPDTPDARIATPDRSVVADKVDEVEIPGAEGYFGVLPGHTPLLATLKVGELCTGKAPRSSICRLRSASRRCCPTASRSLPSSPSGPTILT